MIIINDSDRSESDKNKLNTVRVASSHFEISYISEIEDTIIHKLTGDQVFDNKNLEVCKNILSILIVLDGYQN